MSEPQDKFSFPVPFQTEIVSYLFNDTNMFGKMAGHIKPAFFTEYQLREIMTIALEFFVKYEEIPSRATLLNEINSVCVNANGTQGIEDYQPYISKIYEFSFNEGYVKDNLIKFIKTQSIYKGLRDAYDNMDKEDVVLKIVEESVKVGSRLTYNRGYDYKERIDDRIEAVKKGIRVPNQVEVSMIDIDRVTGNGLGSGELGVILGRPKSGKSIFLCNVAVGACIAGKKVVYYTMEANDKLIGHRIDSRISHYNEGEKKNKLDKMKTAISMLKGDLIIKEFPGLATTPLDLSNDIHGLISDGFHPDLIVVDYIGILAPCTKQREKRHAIQEVCRGLIDHIGKKFEIPVWSAHQSSDVEDDNDIIYPDVSKKPQKRKYLGLSDISEGKIALGSEVTFLVSLNQIAEERRMTPETLKIFVALNRIGREKDIFDMTMDRTRFTIGEAAAINIPMYQ